MPDREDRRALAVRLCEERQIVAAAREQTPSAGTSWIDDAALVERLSAFLDRSGPSIDAAGTAEPVASENFAAAALRVEAARIMRDRLITVLTDSHGLARVAADACRRAGIDGREEQVAYCLVVLCQKADPLRASDGRPPARHYGLDLASPHFAARLEHWADEVARNLRDWSAQYDAIQDDADRHEIATVRSMIRGPSHADDVAVVLADKVAGVLAFSQRLDDMSLALARSVEPMRREYVFQTPLNRWVATIVKRDRTPTTDPIGPDDKPGQDIEDPLDLAAAERRAAYDALVAGILALAETRELLAPVIERAGEVERKADAVRLGNAEDAALLLSARAELGHVVDELSREQGSFGPMLAYLVLAMPPAGNGQRVAILSLRNDRLERSVTETIARQLQAVVDDENQPTPRLVAKATAAHRDDVPRARGTRLDRLRANRAYRRRARVDLTQLLGELPATVGDLASIGAAVAKRMTAGTVATTRGQIMQELRAVDRMFERGFRRYALRVG